MGGAVTYLGGIQYYCETCTLNFMCNSLIFEKEKTCSVFLSSNSNTNGSLGELEMLWEHELSGKCFHSFLEFSKTSTSTCVLVLK